MPKNASKYVWRPLRERSLNLPSRNGGLLIKGTGGGRDGKGGEITLKSR